MGEEIIVRDVYVGSITWITTKRLIEIKFLLARIKKNGPSIEEHEINNSYYRWQIMEKQTLLGCTEKMNVKDEQMAFKRGPKHQIIETSIECPITPYPNATIQIGLRYNHANP
jgi:hypothetical protein